MEHRFRTVMCGWLPCCKDFFELRRSSAGAVMCTAFAVRLTAAPMRSADRLPIIPTGIAPDDACGFFQSGRALSITAYFTLANALNLLDFDFYWRGRYCPRRFSVWLRAVSPSRPSFGKAARAAAVNAGRKATAAGGAERGVDGREHGARMGLAGPLMRTPPGPVPPPAAGTFRPWP